MKRYLTFLLALLMVILPLASCSDAPADNGGGDGTGASDTSPNGGDNATDKSEVLDVPANLKLGGTFEILTPTELSYNYTRVDFDEPSDNAYDNAMYVRNSKVEEYLGIEIHQTEADLGEKLFLMFSNSTQAQSGDFDATFNNIPYAAKAVGGGLCLKFDDMFYMDLEKAWWNQDCTDQLGLGGNHYMISGDIALSDKECIWLVYFTKDLITTNSLENPYDLVENGQWTWDKMHTMAQKASYDANANDVLDMSGTDIWGMTTHSENWAAMWQSAGLKLVTLDRDGIPQVSWNTDRFVEVYEDITEFMTDKTCVSPDDDTFSKKAFASGHALFTTEVVAHLRNFRSNEKDFGVVPFPKYDTSTERYNSYVALSSCVLTVGIDNTKLERTSAVLETMASYGRSDLIPTYYEDQLKSRFARDEKAAEMLDIIFEYRSYDLGIFFDWGSAYTNLKKAGTNPSQLYARLSKALNKEIEKSLSSLGLF